MITDKDRLDAPYMPSALLTAIRRRSGGHWGWSNKKALDKIYERDKFIRAESAEQARKEADEKLAIAVKALKNIIDGNDLACERGESMASWMDSDFRRQAKDALKEIQG